jgi:beta-glucosidase
MGLLLLLLQVFLWTAIVGGLAWVGACVWLHLRHPEPYWDWGNLAIDDVSFPGDFLWGVATAAHQVEGGSSDSNWTWWESQSDPSGMPRIAGGQAAGDACDHWNRYPEDIELMKQLGVSSYRFSIDWARVEPRPGEFDADAIAHYHGVLAALKEAGIRPCITLLHFSWPMWFEQLGAFEKSANIAHFERFARRMFQEYRPACKLWCTVNEAEVVSLMGYLLGMFPPGQQDLHTALLVQRNLVLAHAKVYQALKHMPGGGTARIGFVKNIFQFEPFRRWNLAEWVLARLVEWAHNGAIMRYMATGMFISRVPWLAWITAYDPEVRGAGDFIGLNYYSHGHVRIKLDRDQPVSLAHRPHETPTDFHFAMYPEGLHRALHRLAALGKPIFVTENGVPDATDRIRDTFIRRYLYALHRARIEGVDVQGYYYWTLMDNFEWAEGYHQRFGLYHVDFDTQKRTLREGAKAYARVIRECSDAAY